MILNKFPFFQLKKLFNNFLVSQLIAPIKLLLPIENPRQSLFLFISFIIKGSNRLVDPCSCTLSKIKYPSSWFQNQPHYPFTNTFKETTYALLFSISNWQHKDISNSSKDTSGQAFCAPAYSLKEIFRSVHGHFFPIFPEFVVHCSSS